MSAEESLSFGLIPRLHRGIFAMNELPELDELVQVVLFNILEERTRCPDSWLSDQVRYRCVLSCSLRTLALYNRSGKVIPQLKDRIVQ